jgi:hypothetical protein
MSAPAREHTAARPGGVCSASATAAYQQGSARAPGARSSLTASVCHGRSGRAGRRGRRSRRVATRATRGVGAGRRRVGVRGRAHRLGRACRRGLPRGCGLPSRRGRPNRRNGRRRSGGRTRRRGRRGWLSRGGRVASRRGSGVRGGGGTLRLSVGARSRCRGGRIRRRAAAVRARGGGTRRRAPAPPRGDGCRGLGRLGRPVGLVRPRRGARSHWRRAGIRRRIGPGAEGALDRLAAGRPRSRAWARSPLHLVRQGYRRRVLIQRAPSGSPRRRGCRSTASSYDCRRRAPQRRNRRSRLVRRRR